MTEQLHQIIYASTATKAFSPEDLRLLLQKARAFNQSAGISGMLVHDDGFFLQVLEGAEDQLRALYAKIEKDPRHAGARLLYNGEVAKKEFEDWSMGFIDTSGTAEQSEGFVQYRDLKAQNLEKTRARKILRMFQEGTWRQDVSR